MNAMLLRAPRPVEQSPLELAEVATPEPRSDEILVRVRACGVCHTDLHTVEGELVANLPIVPGHQIVGVDQRTGDRVGIPWLHRACGKCDYCQTGRENLCDVARFTGLHVNGGYAEYAVVPAQFAVTIPEAFDDAHAAPLLCAGIVGYRALRLALEGHASAWPPVTAVAQKRDPSRLGLYGFGASAHLVIQIAVHWQHEVLVATRSDEHQKLARELGAAWVGRAEEMPHASLDAAVMFAPAGALVPEALRALRKGGTLALAGIYMTPIPRLPYEWLYHERIVRSVANATRDDARQFMHIAAQIPIRTEVATFPLARANEALLALKRSQLRGAAVLTL
jgi:propanol-preferring alcohol dehydrogenase